MSTTTQLPPRSLSGAQQLATLFGTELRRLATARKTIVLAAIQLMPVLAALIFVTFGDVDGLTMFRRIVEYVTIPFLLPLAALFYGGPAVVDEMEGRTLTYLTIRPVPKPVLFLGKLLAGQSVALLVVLVPLLILFALCLGGSADLSDSWASLAHFAGASALGVVVYTAIFALLGALFATSLIAGIIYFMVIEVGLSFVPVLELVSMRYYLRTAAGLSATDRLGLLDRLVLEEPLVFDWWVGVVVILMATVVAAVAGATIFKDRQYHV